MNRKLGKLCCKELKRVKGNAKWLKSNVLDENSIFLFFFGLPHLLAPRGRVFVLCDGYVVRCRY